MPAEFTIPAIHSPSRDARHLPAEPAPSFERAAQDCSRVVEQLLSSAKVSLAVSNAHVSCSLVLFSRSAPLLPTSAASQPQTIT